MMSTTQATVTFQDALNLATMDTLAAIGKKLKESADNYGEQTDDTAA